MCGRKTLTKDKTEIIKEYLVNGTNVNFNWQPNFNIAPSQSAPILIEKDVRTIIPMRWGLIPHWAKDEKIGYKMINARSESLLEKKSFAPLMQNHRCVVITDGYYEWRNDHSEKIPYFIFRENRDFISMAGLWSKWQSDSGEMINTYTIITTEPQQNISHIHNRMPAILHKEHLDIWLDNEKYHQDYAIKLLKPYDKKLLFHPVSTFMNSTKNNSIKCIEKYESGTLSLF